MLTVSREQKFVCFHCQPRGMWIMEKN